LPDTPWPPDELEPEAAVVAELPELAVLADPAADVLLVLDDFDDELHAAAPPTKSKAARPPSAVLNVNDRLIDTPRMGRWL
jgi:hypothetical protein